MTDVINPYSEIMLSETNSEPVPESYSRSLVVYNDSEKRKIENDRLMVQSSIQDTILNNNNVIFQDQYDIGVEITNYLLLLSIWCIQVILPTQAGKTGCMIAAIKIFVENNYIPKENVYIITGHSDTEWRDQTKDRVGAILSPRVYHRNELSTFLNDIKGKKNVLIMIDEVQIGSKCKQTMYKVFKGAGFLDKDYIYSHDIKMVEFSATPDGTLYDVMNWDYGTKKIVGHPGDGYTSSHDLLQNEQVKQFKSLTIVDNVKDIEDDIRSFSEPRYHIIRCPNGKTYQKVVNNFTEVYRDSYIYINYDGNNKELTNINDILRNQPLNHTFIFIKEKLRCAKTLIKTYIGVCYDRYVSKISDSVIIQGFAGRCTGYDVPRDIIVYTNIESLKRYEALFNDGFNDRNLPWYSETTQTDNDGMIIARGRSTFNKECYDETRRNEIENQVITQLTYSVKIYEKDDFQVMANYVKNNYNKNIRKIKANSNGFVYKKIRNREILISANEMTEENINAQNAIHKGTANNDYKLFPIYTDILDPTTLQWALVYKNN